jgi:hypothetical protein
MNIELRINQVQMPKQIVCDVNDIHKFRLQQGFMETIKLNDNLLLTFEPDNKKLRLVITDGITELACRKETPANLHRFLTGGQNSLFKGRLQLHNITGDIAIVLKGNPIGLIPTADFTKQLNTLSADK